MGTPLGFLNKEEDRGGKPTTVKILALTNSPDGLESTTALLETQIPNSKVLTGRFEAGGMKKVRSVCPDIILVEWKAGDASCIGFLKSLQMDRDTERFPLLVFTKEPSDRKIRIRSFALGANAFIEGPIHEKELAAQVKTLVESYKEISKGLLQGLRKR